MSRCGGSVDALVLKNLIAWCQEKRRGLRGDHTKMMLFFQGRKNQSPAASETHEPSIPPTQSVPNGHPTRRNLKRSADARWLNAPGFRPLRPCHGGGTGARSHSTAIG